MKDLKKYFATGVLAAGLLWGRDAKAMPIPQFDKMDYRDQGHYVTLLVQGVNHQLNTQGQTDQAKKLLSFFDDRSDNGGMRQSDKNLDIIRALNQSNAADPNYNKPPYEVEHAMALTLKNDGITVPVSTLLAINKDFRPACPPAKTDK